ncbi:DUF6438 domain-containing protein [Kordia sp.]|uniref:DUF6438 domain-containing protein n=1 Tax=Kordia sp. TaxID=1965332 RepID=UPI003B590774
MKTLVLSVLVLTLVSCDASTKEFIGSSWRITDLVKEGKSIPVANEVTLFIKSDTEFLLKLDRNSCFGTYEITGKDGIKMLDLGCTKICCDSEFSLAVVNALSKVSKINLNKDRVTLSGENVTVKFKKELKASNRIKMMQKDKKIIVKDEGSRQNGKISSNGKIQRPNESKEKVAYLPSENFIMLYKSPCKGSCEEYQLKILEDGLIYYTGESNATIKGRHRVEIPAKDAMALYTAFEQVNFNSFEDNYINERLMDLQYTKLTFRGKTIKIRGRDTAPEKLRTLLEKVEEQGKIVLEKLKNK